MVDDTRPLPGRSDARARAWKYGLIGVAAVAIVGASLLWYRSKAGAGAQQAGPPPVAVTAAQAKKQSWQTELHAVGTLAAVQGVQVTTELGGLVSAIHFESGQSVDEGDLLVDLSTDTDRARLESLTAQAVQAQSDLNRLQQLVGKGAVARAEVERGATALDSLKAQVQEQRALIAKKRIRAPFTGELGIRAINVGQFLSPGTEIVPLQSVTPIHVNFSLPERHYDDIAVGQTLQVRVDAFPDRVFTAFVKAINPQVEEQTRNFDIQGELPNDERLLRPGMFSQVTVVLEERHDVVTVPATAITYSPQGNSVFVVREPARRPPSNTKQPNTKQPTRPPPSTVSRAYVKVGEHRGNEVTILSGLRPGTRVVTAGQIKLFDGAPVIVSQADRVARAQGTPTGP